MQISWSLCLSLIKFRSPLNFILNLTNLKFSLQHKGKIKNLAFSIGRLKSDLFILLRKSQAWENKSTILHSKQDEDWALQGLTEI